MATLFCCLILLSFGFLTCSAEYRTLAYKGSNYTYAGEEKGSYNETMEWCRLLNGTLPAIQTRRDVDFILRLTGRHRDEAGLFVDPVRTNDFAGSSHWDEQYTGPCCGKVLRTSIFDRNIIVTSDICSGVKRRKVCKLNPNAIVRDRAPDPTVTTVSPYATLSHREAEIRLVQQHDNLIHSLDEVMERVEVMEESIPFLVESKMRDVPAHMVSHQVTLVDAGLDSLAHRIAFMTFLIFMFAAVILIVKAIPILRTIRRKRLSREPISLGDLLGRGE